MGAAPFDGGADEAREVGHAGGRDGGAGEAGEVGHAGDGDGDAGVSSVTTVEVRVVELSAGGAHTCALLSDQSVRCWGLAREIESQGVSRKVAADMFGLALRTYQKKVTRLSESASERGTTLWQSVLEYVEGQPGAGRSQVLKRFEQDDARDVIAVLGDLVGSGVLYSSGRGEGSIYRPTSSADRTALADRESADALCHLVWLRVYRGGPLPLSELHLAMPATPEALSSAVQTLLRDGRLSEGDGGLLKAERFFIPVGAQKGWEAAVFDHFQAVATAIAEKLRRGPGSAHEDVVGGGTLSFELYTGHPYAAEVQSLLATTRRAVNDLWQRAEDYDRAHPTGDLAKTKLTFYYGQTMDGAPIEARGALDGAHSSETANEEDKADV